MINTIEEFQNAVRNAGADVLEEIFEFDCTDELRDEIYNLADADSLEPFNNAMSKLGFEL